jgi:adenine-specific DNA-methyltransferase
MWCDVAFPLLHKPSLPYSQPLSGESELNEFVAVLNELDFIEATYWLSSSYALLVNKNYRKQLALFFTPRFLAEGLLKGLTQQGVDFASQSFMDPACGGAAFLGPIALRIRGALMDKGFSPLKRLKHIEKHLYGTDLDKTLCGMSKHFLYMALYDEIQKTNYWPVFEVHQANSLVKFATSQTKVDVVVCNPPYRKMTADELKPLRDAYPEVVEAQPNLYSLFIALCVRLLQPEGCAALVTPTSFHSGRNFGRLREFLIQHTDVEHIGLVSNRQGVFIDALQRTVLTTLRRRTGKKRTYTRSNVSVVSETGAYKAVGKCLLPNGGAIWPIPRSVEDMDLLKVAIKSRFRLSDYGYKIRVGAYVWNRDKRPKFESIKEAKRAKAKAAIPLLWSRDIRANKSIQFDDVALNDGKHRFVDLGERAHSSMVCSPCVVMQRVTSDDQSHRLVASTVPEKIFKKYGGFIGENHVIIIEQVDSNPLLSPAKLAKLLSTRIVDRCFRCISGTTNVSIFELNQLALPDPRILQKIMLKERLLNKTVLKAYRLSREG